MRRKVISITFRRKRETNSSKVFVGLTYHSENKIAITANERTLKQIVWKYERTDLHTEAKVSSGQEILPPQKNVRQCS